MTNFTNFFAAAKTLSSRHYKNVTLSIMALDEMTFSVVTHSLMALWIIKYSVINDYQHNDTQHSKKCDT